jgi:hypothetical protein
MAAGPGFRRTAASAISASSRASSLRRGYSTAVPPSGRPFSRMGHFGHALLYQHRGGNVRIWEGYGTMRRLVFRLAWIFIYVISYLVVSWAQLANWSVCAVFAAVITANSIAWSFAWRRARSTTEAKETAALATLVSSVWGVGLILLILVSARSSGLQGDGALIPKAWRSWDEWLSLLSGSIVLVWAFLSQEQQRLSE